MLELFSTEGKIAACIVALQVTLFFYALWRIRNLWLFVPANPEKLLFFRKEAFEVAILSLHKRQTGKDFRGLIASINRYIGANKGTASFSVVKDIVERNVASKDLQAAGIASLPLYIGLMGTFLGIIVGLINIDISEETAAGATIKGTAINAFIRGVITAMAASLVGLFLTVINNALCYNRAKALCNLRKNRFYDFLQTNVLVYTDASLHEALDKLKNNIHDFNSRFEKNIELFDTKFTGNIESLKGSVASFSTDINNVIESTKTQKEFLLALKKSQYSQIAESNVKVFELIRESIPSLQKFTEDQKNLAHSLVAYVDKQKEFAALVEKANAVVVTIEAILNRVKTFEDSVNALGHRISDAKYLGNDVLDRIDKNLSYLDRQYELLQKHENEKAENLKTFFETQYEKIVELCNKVKKEVEVAFDFSISNNPLQKLQLLERLDTHVAAINTQLTAHEQDRIAGELTKTRQDISQIKRMLAAINFQDMHRNLLNGMAQTEMEFEADTEEKPTHSSFAGWWRKFIGKLKRRKRGSAK